MSAAPDKFDRLHPVESVMFTVLRPVRGTGPRLHLVPRDRGATIRAAANLREPALCGAVGPLDRYSDPKWQSARGASGSNLCNACYAAACRGDYRIDWSA